MSETIPTSPAPAAGDDAAGTADAAGALPGSPAGQPPGPLSGLLVADFAGSPGRASPRLDWTYSLLELVPSWESLSGTGEAGGCA